MKTKFYMLLASAALIAQVQGGGHRAGGGGSSAAPAHFAAPTVHSAPMRSFSGQRSPAMGVPSANSSRQRFASPNGGAFDGQRQGERGTSDHRGERLGLHRNERGAASGLNERNHVFARHSADRHRNWDRNRDHWWHGHRCRFVNGSWLIFDLGFYPWYIVGYPYAYYGYDYYPYEYDLGVYEGVDADDYADSTVAAAQVQLNKRGYYRGEIDGIFGPATRRALTRYQGEHGLRATGYLSADTLRALGLRQVARN